MAVGAVVLSLLHFRSAGPTRPAPSMTCRITSTTRVAVIAAAVVLVPYTTLALPFRRALHVQAGLLLVLVLLAGWLGAQWASDGGRSGHLSRVSASSAGAYAAAGALGAAVGLWRGNDLGYLTGQLVSLGLLPLAWLCALPTASQRSLRPIAAGVAGAAALASCGHALGWGLDLLEGRWVSRPFLDPQGSVSGATALAALLILPLQGSKDRRLRWLATAGFWLIAALIVGSGVRGLWLATAAGLVLFAILDGGVRRLLWVRVALPGVVGLSLLVAATAAIQHVALTRYDPLVSPDRLPAVFRPPSDGVRLAAGPGQEPLLSFERVRERRIWPLTAALPIDERRRLRLSAEVGGTGPGEASVGVQWLDGDGTPLATSWSEPVTGPWQRREVDLVPLPGSAGVRLAVLFSADANGRWQVRDLSLHDTGPFWMHAWARQAAFTRSRLRSVLAPAGDDPSISFRLAEGRALRQLLGASSAEERLLGHGLGATYSVAPHLPPGVRGPGETDRLNYIHNFYWFLVVKLGTVGTLAVLLALIGWGWSLVDRSRRLPPGLERHTTSALAAGWLAYCLWSVSSPEILDFRLAPLWGLLLGSAARSPRAEPAASSSPDQGPPEES